MTEHFTLNEFLRSDTASRYKIDNTPNKEQLDNIEFVARQLEIIRSYYNKPMFISSGFRTKELNTLLKGSKTSQHMQGLAVDINLKSKEENKIFFNLVNKLIKENQIKVYQLIDEYNYKWVHIGFSKTNPKGQILHLE